MALRRFVLLSAAVALGATALPMTASIAAAQPASRSAAHAPRAAGDTGGIAINGAADATASADVTVSVPAPTNSFGTLRLSDDDGTTWVERDWNTSLSWSLIDPAAGGVDADGTRTVTVEGGDGLGAWTPIGTASILLDRTGPDMTTPYVENDGRALGRVHVDAVDDGVGVARTEDSLDDVHWLPIAAGIDFRDGTIGGSWQTGPRTVYVRAVDALGNITEADPITATVTDIESASSPLPATFEFPHPAVAGQPFTIKPVFDAGFRLEPRQYCFWRFDWGNYAARIEGRYNETYGEVWFSTLPVNGVCQPWTFTLPATPLLEYTWHLSINPDIDTDGSLYYTLPESGSFRAAAGDTTSPDITTSDIPLAYIVPDRDFVGATGTVTYRLHTVDGAPSDGHWICFPSDGTPRGPWPTQDGGATFSCPVTSNEPWTAYWTRGVGVNEMRASYDPVGDSSKPRVGLVRATPIATVGQSAHVHISWAGKDTGSGLQHYTVQQNHAGRWITLKLSSRLATSLNRTVGLTTSDRFRIRATDRAGNVGAWAYSARFRPTAYDDLSARIAWSGHWSRVRSAGALGGQVHRASARGASVRIRFRGAGIGVLAPTDVRQGFAQVYVDGALADTIRLRSRVASAPRVIWSKNWPATSIHVVQLRTMGTVGHPDVAIDGFVALG